MGHVQTMSPGHSNLRARQAVSIILLAHYSTLCHWDQLILNLAWGYGSQRVWGRSWQRMVRAHPGWGHPRGKKCSIICISEKHSSIKGFWSCSQSPKLNLSWILHATKRSSICLWLTVTELPSKDLRHQQSCSRSGPAEHHSAGIICSLQP